MMVWDGSPLDSSRLWGMVPSSQGADPKGVWPHPLGQELRLRASREATRTTQWLPGQGSRGGLWLGLYLQLSPHRALGGSEDCQGHSGPPGTG